MLGTTDSGLKIAQNPLQTGLKTAPTVPVRPPSGPFEGFFHIKTASPQHETVTGSYEFRSSQADLEAPQ
jgi:hypothetical protein